MLNSAARLVLNILKFSHISAAIRDKPPLASNQEKDRLQNRPYGPSLLGWCCAGIPDGTVPSCWLSRRSTMSPVASRGDFVVPRFRLQTFGHRAFVNSGPLIWNSPPLRSRQSRDNLWLFKQKLKAHLFQQFCALLWIHIQ